MWFWMVILIVKEINGRLLVPTDVSLEVDYQTLLFVNIVEAKWSRSNFLSISIQYMFLFTSIFKHQPHVNCLIANILLTGCFNLFIYATIWYIIMLLIYEVKYYNTWFFVNFVFSRLFYINALNTACIISNCQIYLN